MNYQEAEQRFHWLEAQLTSHQITMDQYRAGLSKLRVTDSAGRLWMPQERTGVWYVYLNGQWQPASAVQNPPQPSPVYARSASRIRTSHQSATRAAKGGGKLSVALLIWLVIVVTVGVGVWLASKEPKAVLTVGALAVLSLLAILSSAASSWEGEVIDRGTETHRTRDEDGDYQTRTVRYAIIRQPNGTTKKVNSSKKWNIGDYVVKRRGEMSPFVANRV
ncbi:MAG: hypothetical protein ACYCZF_11235 [Anaerolineae bacterium]